MGKVESRTLSFVRPPGRGRCWRRGSPRHWSAPLPRHGRSRRPPVVTVAKPVVREIVEDDEFVGRFEAVDEVAIRSRVGGYLDEVHFHDGAMVNEGRSAVHHRPAALPGGL